MNLPALPLSASDLIDEYDEKLAAIEAEISAFKTAVDRLKSAACVGGTYAGSVMTYAGSSIYDAPCVSADQFRKILLQSGWRAIFKHCGIDKIATAKDKALFEQSFADPPPLTKENALATFGPYLQAPRFHALRGLAEAFTQLDPAYKSHSKVRIGVKGLPKRVILSGFGQYSYGSWGRARFYDMMNALAAYRGQMPFSDAEFSWMERQWRDVGDAVFTGTQPIEIYRNGKFEKVVPPWRGVTVRHFQNGNIHIIFDPLTLTDINKALAEFYGDALPDDGVPAETPSRAGTAVSKDLQFYPTPVAVVDRLLGEAGLKAPVDTWDRQRFQPKYVLEPSCGDGQIMDALCAAGHRVLGIEVHPGRAHHARNKGHAVVTANFLDHPPVAEFDAVVMNPPFAGVHWKKHVAHALKFLKPGGRLYSVLPSTAQYDHDVCKMFGGEWIDLPVASFAASGTNVPTGIFSSNVKK